MKFVFTFKKKIFGIWDFEKERSSTCVIGLFLSVRFLTWFSSRLSNLGVLFDFPKSIGWGSDTRRQKEEKNNGFRFISQKTKTTPLFIVLSHLRFLWLTETAFLTSWNTWVVPAPKGSGVSRGVLTLLTRISPSIFVLTTAPVRFNSVWNDDLFLFFSFGYLCIGSPHLWRPGVFHLVQHLFSLVVFMVLLIDIVTNRMNPPSWHVFLGNFFLHPAEWVFLSWNFVGYRCLTLGRVPIVTLNCFWLLLLIGMTGSLGRQLGFYETYKLSNALMAFVAPSFPESKFFPFF